MAKDVVNDHKMWPMAKSQLSLINVKQYDVDNDAYHNQYLMMAIKLMIIIMVI